MRKLLILIAIAMFGFASMQGQDANSIVFDDDGCFSQVIETNATAKQIYNYSKSFLSSRLKDFRGSVQIDDSEQNKLQVSLSLYIGNLPSTLNVGGNTVIAYDCTENSKLTIDGKDGKYRMKLESPEYQFVYFGDVKTQPHTLFKDFVLSKEQLNNARNKNYANLIYNMKQYIEKQVEDEDF